MDLSEWLRASGGVAHRETAAAAGFEARAQRASVAAGKTRVIRRQWLAIEGADADLVAAASLGARVTCVSLAARRGWWMPEVVDKRLHLSLHPHARSPQNHPGGVLHWTKSVSPAPARSLIDSVENALARIAACASTESALVLWESAIRVERLSVEALRQVRWASIAARELASAVTGLSDSGLETLVVVRLSPWGIPIRQQIVIAGHRVDVLIGERLVIQIDGYAHHSTPASRGRDVAHDAELRLRGYTVLRFTYAQVIHDWPNVERTIARAVAMGAHRAI